MTTPKKLAVLALVALWAVPLDAMAYLDPGTGSALLQGILGGLAAIGVVLKLYWHRILRMLGIRKGPDPAAQKKEGAKPEGQ